VRRVHASVVVPGRAEEAEALWLDPARWASWIDGFGHVQSLGDAWPEPGAHLRWVSVPRGRGLVSERVIGRRPGHSLTLEVEDEKLAGTQTVTFASGDDEVRVTLVLEYELKDRTPGLVDRFSVRRALRDALARTVSRFGHERRAELDPPR
jgi:polyketide cyclase/dehydrase/lipid transport protein